MTIEAKGLAGPNELLSLKFLQLRHMFSQARAGLKLGEERTNESPETPERRIDEPKKRRTERQVALIASRAATRQREWSSQNQRAQKESTTEC